MNQSNKKIAVLLSTYNGSEYVEKQMVSILQQKNCEITIHVRDDGSSDNTVAIVKNLMNSYSNIVFYDSEKSNLGSFKSFMWLLQHVKADYYSFADQDDVWVENKLELSLGLMNKLEDENPDKPVLVHTDLTVVDQNLDTINSSFWKSSGINQELLKTNNKYYAVINFVVGCTMLINHHVKKIVFPIHPIAQMHDSWISLNVLYGNGIVGNITTPTVLYRQHQHNVIGAEDVNTFRYFSTRFVRVLDVIKNNYKMYLLADSFKSISIYSFFMFKIKYLLNR